MRRRDSTAPAGLCRHPRWAAKARVLVLAVLGACGGSAAPTPSRTPATTQPGEAPVSAAPTPAATRAEVPPPALLEPGEGPGLFLGPAEDAPAVGYTGPGLVVEPAEPPHMGRVLVRIDGPMRVRAYAVVDRLYQVVQRRGRIRGAPMYVGPGDHVRVVGAAAEPGRQQVAVRARLGGEWSDTFGGTFPSVGLSLEPAPEDAEAPSPGESYVLPAGATLTLHEQPGGTAVAGLPPYDQPIRVDVLRSSNGWRAVRVGDGPYLIGYTRDGLEPGRVKAPVESDEATTSQGPVPVRIEREQGALKRVRAGAKLRFNDTIIAVFKEDGWARVLQEYPGGQVDVFAAGDDSVAVRGLVDGSQLYDPNTPATASAAH